MTVKEIIEKYLKDNGFDGLRHDDTPCGCGLDDLAPCDCNMLNCEPAYRLPCEPDENDCSRCDEIGDASVDCYSPFTAEERTAKRAFLAEREGGK